MVFLCRTSVLIGDDCECWLLVPPGPKCIHLEAPAKINITGVWKHILKNWNAYGMNGTKGSMGIGGRTYWMSYTNIWTVATFIRALHVSDATPVIMSTCSPFHARKDIFVLHAIKSVLSSSENFFMRMCWIKSLTDSG